MQHANDNPFEAIAQKKAELDKLIAETGEKAVKRALRDAFTSCPSLKKIVWTQYTPYFMDGDPCVFSFNGLHADFGKEVGYPYGEDVDPEDCSIYDLWECGSNYRVPTGIEDEHWQMLDKLNGDFYANEELLLACFGDHVKVTVTPTELTVDQYDHD